MAQGQLPPRVREGEGLIRLANKGLGNCAVPSRDTKSAETNSTKEEDSLTRKGPSKIQRPNYSEKARS